MGGKKEMIHTKLISASKGGKPTTLLAILTNQLHQPRRRGTQYGMAEYHVGKATGKKNKGNEEVPGLGFDCEES